MKSRAARLVSRLLVLLGLLTGIFPGLQGIARAQASLRGVVFDSAGGPIRDVDIGVVALKRLTKTDEAGRFALAKLPPGELVVSVRRIGYEPITIHRIIVEDVSDSVAIQLERVAMLETLEVTAREMRKRFWVEDFYRRVVRGVGTYFTRTDIEQKRASTPTDLMRSVPGVQIIRTRSGRGIRFVSASSFRRNCMPMLWLDGQEAPGMQLDDVPLNTIEGIELYNGPSTTPMQFSQTSQVSCGTIVIWTRIPGT